MLLNIFLFFKSEVFTLEVMFYTYRTQEKNYSRDEKF